jgi:hypothetical protein
MQLLINKFINNVKGKVWNWGNGDGWVLVSFVYGIGIYCMRKIVLARFI